MSDVWIVLVSVGVGWLLSVSGQVVAHRVARRQRRRDLMLRVCAALEEFIYDCQDAIDDEGDWSTGVRDFGVPLPTGPVFPKDVDWTTIDQRLAYEVLALQSAPRRFEQRLAHIFNEVAHPPEREEAFEFRRQKCEEMLSGASYLSDALQRRWRGRRRR